MTKSELHDFELDVLALANDMAATCIQHHLLRSFTPGSAGSCRLAEYRGAFFALQPPICVPPTRATSSTFPEVGAGANALPLNLQGRVG